MVVTKSSKIADSRSAGMPDPVSATVISTRSPARAVAIVTRPPGCGRLDGVGDQVAEDAAEREAVAVDRQRAVGVARLDGDAVALALGPHRVDDLGDRRR